MTKEVLLLHNPAGILRGYRDKLTGRLCALSVCALSARRTPKAAARLAVEARPKAVRGRQVTAKSELATAQYSPQHAGGAISDATYAFEAATQLLGLETTGTILPHNQ